MSSSLPVTLALAAEPRLARLVRMTASNAGLLSNMSVERVEDIRMAAEEAFVYACALTPGEPVSITFEPSEEALRMAFALSLPAFPEPGEDDASLAYADLILGSVCDSYTKVEQPATLVLELEADAR